MDPLQFIYSHLSAKRYLFACFMHTQRPDGLAAPRLPCQTRKAILLLPPDQPFLRTLNTRLAQFMQEHGDIRSACVMVDQVTKKSRNFGFVKALFHPPHDDFTVVDVCQAHEELSSCPPTSQPCSSLYGSILRVGP